MTRAFVRRAGVTAAAGLLLTLALAGPAAADHQIQHFEAITPAVDKFFADVPRLTDAEWGLTMGGFGGRGALSPIDRAPVIFVHGNVVDHADFYPVRDDFLAAGWTMQELWALAYNGMGNGSGSSPIRSNPELDEDHAGADNVPRGTNNDTNIPDLAAFVKMVQAYTGSDRVHLVGHSLGVTVMRKAMFNDPNMARDVVSVTAIAGANNGTSLCAPVVSRGTHMSCDEIDQGTDWLAELNGADGVLETYGPTAWLTVFDGTGAGDVAFVGPSYASSPQLMGADELVFPGVDHNGLRMGVDQVAAYRVWIEAADDAVGGASTDPLPGVVEDENGNVAFVDGQPVGGNRSTGGSGRSIDGSADVMAVAEEQAADNPLPITGGGASILGVALSAMAVAVTRSTRRP
jgi:pimeloyl-ACP methyl ester carboxylesterase